MARLGKLVANLVARGSCVAGRAAMLDLLEQVVLLLAHSLAVSTCCLLFALLELVLQRLSIDAHTTVTDDLLACVGRDRIVSASLQLTNPLQS